MSSLFPMARNHREYWQNIVDGVDCTSEVPESRWRLDDYYDPDPEAPDKTYSRRGAFLPDVEFDPLEFGIPPNQLDVTSTMQTLSLGVARDLLRDAGTDGSDWYDPARTGVVLGVTGPVPLMHPLAARLSTPVLKEVVRAAGLTASDAEEIAHRYVRAFAPWEENSFPGFLANVVAGRVANRLDLGGLNATVDAACAASLAALRTAIAELVDGRADMMITGGVDTENTIFVYLSFGKVGALSKTDRISPFSDDADGTLLGEGIGMVALRRLADAERDGNRIYAVIRGLGSSSDGRAKSIYAPRAEGQRAALDRAYEDAECSPASVALFEAHATGTAVGDRTELIALRELLDDNEAERHTAALGSVKSQIGHTKGAAGTASLMKLALALYHKNLPPTINVERPNSGVDFDSAPFYINVKNRPWISDPRRPVRRAAASAMGFGGTNFHVVLEEHNTDRSMVRNLHRTARAHVWHAPDPVALLELLNAATPPADGGPVPAEHARVGFVATDEETATQLRARAAERIAADPDAEQWSDPHGVYYRRRAMADIRVGALFAGQGSQYLDMGLEAALNVPTVAAAFDEANMSFTGARPGLATAVFPPPVFDAGLRRAQEATLHRTEYAQPAIGALSVGQFRFLHELGLRAHGFAGHSFGELTALWASGAVSAADYFRLAVARGTAMAPTGDTVDAGAMVAVAASRERVEKILADISDAVICNHNAPEQVVVGGGTAAMDTVLAACAERRISARRLKVSAAFHTRYVRHAVDRFRTTLETVRIGGPRAPVYANSPGARYGTDPVANAETLARQLLWPVEFMSSVRAMHADGVTTFVEFGPKQILTGLVRSILPEADVVAIPTDTGPLGDSDVALKQAAVQLVVLGVELTGINRYDASPAVEAKPAGMTITLSAPEYVPPARQAAYRAGLTDGFRAALPAPERGAASVATSVPTPESVSAARSRRVQEETTMTAHPQPAHRAGDDPAAQHLALHTRYLESQLQVAETLVGLVTERGLNDPRLPQLAESVKDQSVAIGQAHARATEVLARLAELEVGAAPASGLPAAIAPAAPVALPPAAVPAPTAAVAPDPPAHVAPSAVSAAPSETAVGAGVSAGSVRGVLVDAVAEMTGYPADLVEPGMDLEADLGVDSIKRVQVLGVVQEHFPDLPTIGPEQLGELRTIDQVVGFLMGEAGGVDPKELSPTAEPIAAVGDGSLKRYRVDLVDLPPIDRLEQPFPAEPVAVVADHGGADAVALAAGLTRHGWTVRRVDLSAQPDVDALERACAEATADPIHLALAILDAEPDPAAAERRLTETIVLAKHAQRGLRAAGGPRAAFVTLTRLDGGLGLLGEAEPEAALIGGAGGVVKTLAVEAPELFCRAVDLHPEIDPDAALTALLAELHDAAGDTTEVGIDRAGVRRTVTPGRHSYPAASSTVDVRGTLKPSVTADDVFVAVGGGRGITARCVAALAEYCPAQFVLLGKTALTEEPGWATGVADADLRAAVIAELRADGNRPSPRDIDRRHAELLAQREIRATLARIEAAGATASYHTVDVTDAEAVHAALADRRVTGIVHGAGVLADALLADKTAAQVQRVCAPKLRGLAAVLAAVDTAELRHLVLFTSVAGLFGNAGQADYAAANEALCRFAASWRHRHPGRHVVAINWGAWDGGMVGPELRELFTARGVRLLDPAMGARAFVEQFTADHVAQTQVLIGEDISPAGDRPSTARPLVAYRDLGGLERDPVIRDHRIGPHEVLPATFGLGWLINVAERAHPGLRVVRAREFQVYKGIVFDGGQARDHHVELTDCQAIGDRVIVRATVRGDAGRAVPTSHYAATLELAARPDAAPSRRLRPPGAGAGDALPIYTGAIQFHGPHLQGMRQILEFTDERLVVRCRLRDLTVAGGSFAGRSHSPVLADVMLQGPSVLGSRVLGQACLPLGIESADYYAPLPDDRDFVLVVDELRRSTTGITVTATATDESGRVLVRFTGAEYVATPAMAAKFAESVAHWQARLGPVEHPAGSTKTETLG
ncbi:SDR family NAD(P)-dependent oxidoreductase [Streptomyces botrytidirepellens]|uniref:SDR family NAD(P)-dependent oxidoreductase n=2 Tax=Streptomyces botrytidirepellens TaxID=2486417 RepID=A0A3M8X1A7_9ACTN|nr:SDR family NAD(P)-dependent oxidoreductase [Streptomyces botrytidirepellens]